MITLAPPGPRSSLINAIVYRPGRNPLAFLTDLARTYGDVAGYGDTMVRASDRMRQGWRDGAALDIAQEMNRLTLSVVGKTLFDADLDSQARGVGEALTGVMQTFWLVLMPFADVIERLPLKR